MKVSVIVATYERPDFLERSLAGFLDQTRPPDELLVADDGSGQATADLVADVARRASFPVHHVWQEDKGFRKTRILNRAAVRATGEYLILTDHDCIPGRRHVADHLRAARRGCFAVGKRILLGPRGSEGFTGREGWGRILKLVFTGQINKPHLLVRCPPLVIRSRSLKGVRGCNFALFREDLERVNGWNEDFEGYGREDSELVVRLMRAGCVRRTPLHSCVVWHLYHDTSERGELQKNDPLLEAAHTAPLFTPRGMRAETPSQSG